MELKTKNINSVLSKKSLYLMLFIFFFIFSGSNALLARASFCKGPADVVLAIDRSANMAGGTKFDTVKNSSVDFIDSLFAIPPYDSFYPYNYHQAGLVVFNNNISSEFLTTDDAHIKNVILNLGVPNSSCKAGLAVQRAQANLNTNGNIEATKTIIILISGPPDDLAFAIEQVGVAKGSGTRIISVGINLDELVDSQRKADAESFISNEHISSYDCYYASDNPDASLDGCTSISTDDLNNSLNIVYNDITGAVCDEIAPDLEIHRIPSGTLYDIDKLTITSIATDDVGFQSHSIVWGYDWPDYQTEITDCSLVGKVISCNTGELGSFAVGEVINFGSSAKDANDNVITIDPVNNAVTVAAVSLDVPTLFRNEDNEISVQISNYSGADEFYIRIDNGELIRVIDEGDTSSKMTCSGIAPRSCVYSFNPGCASEGVYTDPGNAVDVYIYAESSGITRTSYIASNLNNALGISSEGVSSGNCSNGIDDDCDGIIDSNEILCDSDLPIVAITRTNPIETNEVYDDDASITLKSEASDSNSTIKRNTIYYRIAGSSTWETAFDCNDVAVIDGKCDEDISKSIASFSVAIDLIFPASAGTEIEYYSEAVDSSGNDNTSSTSVKSFIVKSVECDGKGDLDSCAVSDGQCCGGVCNTSAVNSGPSGSYNIDFCAELSCDGVVLEWIPNSFTGQCSEFGDSNSCYSYTPDPLASPYLLPDPYDNNGCEIREYRCNSGYCNYGIGDTRRVDGCDVSGPNSLIWRDFQCESGECKPIQEWEDEQCDDTISFTDLIVTDSDGVNITGVPEVLDSKTDKIRITANVADPNGIANYKIYWQLNGGSWQEKNCGSCGPSTEATACSCTQEIGSFEYDDFVNYYMWSQDNSPNQNEEYVGFDGGLNYDYYTHSSSGTDRKGTFKGSDIDTNPDHYWGSTIQIDAANVWEDQSDAAITWEGFITPDVLGEYRIYAQSDDGIRVYINGEEVIEYFPGYLYDPHTGTYTFTSLNPVPIKIVWYDSGGPGRMRLGWLPPGETTETYPIPAANLIAPYALAVRDSECYDINFDYTLSTNRNDIETLCDSDNGICCGGYCDSSPSSTSYDEECRVNSCSGINWVYAVNNALGDTKEGDLCGSTDTCFDYYSPNNSFYSGCITGGDKCSSGYCAISSTLISTPSCNGSLLTNYSCDPDNATGTCQPKDSNIDCSSTGDYDSDSVDCNCDCNGYDREEKVYSSLSFDGVDDYVDVGNVLSPGSSSFSIGLWFKWDGKSGENILYNKESLYEARVYGGYFYYAWRPYWSWVGGSVFPVNSGEWYYVTVVYDKAKQYIYKNGQLVYSRNQTGNIGTNSSKFLIGARGDSNPYNYFSGSIDDVRIYNRALYPEEVVDQYNGIFADDTSLVGHWDFDEGTGETASDSSGNGNDGVLSNVDGTLYGNPKWETGKYGNGIELDGSGDYVNISADLENPSAMSLEFWFYVDEADKNRTQYFMDGRNGGNWWFLQSYSPSGSGNINFNNYVKVDSSEWSAGQWNHLILATNSSNSNIYINGDLKATGSAFNPDLGANLRIGTRYTNSSYFRGKFDEVRIYNRALSDAEAVDHYKGIFSDNSDLVGYWDFNEGTGTTAYDNSENGPQWTKYHYDSTSGIGGNVPVPWQVCTDGKDNDCDSITDEYEVGDSWCDGKIDEIMLEASSKRIGVGGATATAIASGGAVTSIAVVNGGSGYTFSPVISITGGGGSGATATAVLTGGVITSINIVNGGSGYTFSPAVTITEGNLLNFLTPVDYDVYDIDVSQAPNDFTLSAVVSDEFGISQTLIEWTTDNWGTTNDVTCNSTGVCKVCVVGGSCSNDEINPSSLAADTVFTYRACAWDNNSNKTCSSDYSFVVLNSNSIPLLTDLEVIVPDFCEKGLEYILSWKFNDDDILDKQSYYEVQVKEGNNDFTTGPFVINLLKYVTADNSSLSYHPIIKGENKEINMAESGSNNTLTDDNALWITDEWEDGTIEIISGTGIGQTRTVNSNDGTQIKISSNWDTIPDNTSEFEVKSVDLIYGEKEYYWRVRATDNKTGGYAKTSEWVEGSETFTTPAYKLPQIEFSVNLDSDPSKDCFLEECDFGEDIVFHDDTIFFVSCNSLNDSQCLSLTAAKCDNNEGQCVPCSNINECTKFNSDIHYSCIDGICEISSGACDNDDDCKSVDNAKCDIDSGQCVACDTDSQCEQFILEDEYYICNAGKCEFPSHRTWDFYSDSIVNSTNPDPINNYVESTYDNYDVILKITDITGEYCSKSKNIKLGGELYPKWNEVSSSN